MTRSNPFDLQPFDLEIDRTFLRLVRHHLVPFEHPENSVIGYFEHYSFEHSDFVHSENMKPSVLKLSLAPN